MILVLIGAPLLRSGTAIDTYMPSLLWTAGLVLFVSRITGRPYRGFWFVLREIPGGQTRERMTMSERWAVVGFLWWKLLIPLGVASVLVTMLGGAGLGRLAAGLIVLVSLVLVIGPILLKSMVIDPFENFQILVRRREL